MTGSTMRWSDDAAKPQTIGGERRADRRYELRLDVKWKLIRRRKVLGSGTGHTVDLSSGGVMFDAGRELPVGLNVEISIAWPIRLHDVAALQLVVSGRIVRTAGGHTAIRMVQHEFRTASIPVEHRGAPAAMPRNGSRFFSNMTNVAGLGRCQ